MYIRENCSLTPVFRPRFSNALDRLTQVTGSDISTETYTYDHQGRRIEKNVGGAINRYTYSGMSIWAEFGATWGDALAYYNYTGVDKAVIRSTPNTADTRYYHNDGLGSAVAVTNAAGATQASTRYDSWGTVIAGGGVPQFGFTGREPDATGLMYFRARYYDPGMGRFTQRDPIGFAGGLNPYTYVNNSPQNFTDPLGLAQAAVNVGGNVSSAWAGNNSAPTVANSGCGGRVGMCHTPDQNVQPPQIYTQTGEWWDENRAEIGSAATDLNVLTAIISTGFRAIGPVGIAPAIFFGGVSVVAAGVDALASPPPSSAQVTGRVLDTSISAALPAVPSMAYDAIRPFSTIANNPSIFQSGIESNR